MKWVYAIGFEGDRFLMVNNPKRGGWEMPGGKVEKGEEPKDASVREYREEAGVLFLPVDCIEYNDGLVYAGEVVDDHGKGEMRWQLFEDLPDELSFLSVEYVSQIKWARGVMAKHRSQPRIEAKSGSATESRIK